MERVVNNINYVNTSSNEAIVRHTLNRNFEKLLENDINLNNLKNILFEGKIKTWTSDETYNQNDIVWFKEEGVEQTEKPITYLLRSIIDNNSNKPQKQLVNFVQDFRESGWENLDKYSTLIQDNLQAYVYDVFNEYVHDQHEKSDYHRYGEINKDNIGDYFLLRDMSNLDTDRDYGFYPYQTMYLSSDNTIKRGYYKMWDNGIIEYNIIFQLGYTGEKITYDDKEYDIVRCNDLSIENSDYFLNENDAYILCCDFSNNKNAIINDHIETNRGKYVNSYSSKITFPIEFIDTNYMIFSSNISNRSGNTQNFTIDKGMCSLTYTNKTKKTITPIFILYPDKNNTDTSKSGLINNNFHCQIIGKWK